MKDLFLDAGAEFSGDRKRRLALWRIWDETKPKVMFIGLNPSTADENKDDPTIRRVIRFARDWGFGGVYMCNLFTQVTPNPKELEILSFPSTILDNAILRTYGELADEIVFAWGSFKQARKRGKEVAKMFPCAVALEINQDGTPKHPLYVRADIKRIPFVVINNMSFDLFKSELTNKLLHFEKGFSLDNDEWNDLYIEFKTIIGNWKPEYVKDLTAEQIIKEWTVDFFQGNNPDENIFWLAVNNDGWYSSKLVKPRMNVGVLVFIPGEDNHKTTGMWDVSKKWVLLDEYRVPDTEVTYWRELPEDPITE